MSSNTSNTNNKFISKFSAEAIEAILEEGVTGLSGGTLSEQIARLQQALIDATDLENQLNGYIAELQKQLEIVKEYDEKIDKAQSTADEAATVASAVQTDAKIIWDQVNNNIKDCEEASIAISGIRSIIGSTGDTGGGSIFARINDTDDKFQNYTKTSDFENLFDSNVSRVGLVDSAGVNQHIYNFVGASDFSTGVASAGGTIFVKDSDFSTKFNSAASDANLIDVTSLNNTLSSYATNESVSGVNASLTADIESKLNAASDTFDSLISDGKIDLSNYTNSKKSELETLGASQIELIKETEGLRGPTGPTGATGQQGPQGEKGESGEADEEIATLKMYAQFDDIMLGFSLSLPYGDYAKNLNLYDSIYNLFINCGGIDLNKDGIYAYRAYISLTGVYTESSGSFTHGCHTIDTTLPLDKGLSPSNYDAWSPLFSSGYNDGETTSSATFRNAEDQSYIVKNFIKFYLSGNSQTLFTKLLASYGLA